MKDPARGGFEDLDCIELRDFVRLFESGEFFASHEVLEARWLRTRDPFEQGLIILASAFVHRDRGNVHGARRQLEKALRYFAPYPAIHRGIAVGGLRAHAVAGIEGLLAAPEASPQAVLTAPRLQAKRGSK